MIGLDTNVLVRYVVGDDPAQSAQAQRVVESLTDDVPGFVSVVVLVELHWVLRRRYRATVDEAAAVVRGLLDAKQIVVAESDVVRRAHSQVRRGVDFVDALVGELGDAAGCENTATFDQKAARHPAVRCV